MQLLELPLRATWDEFVFCAMLYGGLSHLILDPFLNFWFIQVCLPRRGPQHPLLLLL